MGMCYVGNEGYGLRTTVRQSCEALLRIDSGSDINVGFGLDSLNVSVATGILLHSIISSASESNDKWFQQYLWNDFSICNFGIHKDIWLWGSWTLQWMERRANSYPLQGKHHYSLSDKGGSSSLFLSFQQSLDTRLLWGLPHSCMIHGLLKYHRIHPYPLVQSDSLVLHSFGLDSPMLAVVRTWHIVKLGGKGY